MIRKQLKKTGPWIFILCLLGFIAANYRLNSLEKSLKTARTATEEVFAAVPDSTGIRRITIQHEADTGFRRVIILIKPNTEQVEYQPALPNIGYTFARTKDELLIKIRPSNPKEKRTQFNYSSVELHLPTHITAITLESLNCTLNFPKQHKLSEIQLTSVGSSIDINDINVDRLTLRDQPKNAPEQQHSEDIGFSGFNAINHLAANLAYTDLTLAKLDLTENQTIMLDLHDKATLNADAPTLQKVIWPNVFKLPDAAPQ
jgi:hypothetical protein